MGNGLYQKMLKCCNINEELKKGDIYINNNNILENNLYNNNLENNNIIKKDDNKNEQKIIKTKSHQSSKISSLNKSKNEIKEGEISHQDFEPYSSGYNKNSQILNGISFKQNKKSSLTNICSKQNKTDKLYYNSKYKSSLINGEKNNLDDILVEPKTKLILTGELFFYKTIEIDKNGMKNGLRKKDDSITIFGIKNMNDNSDSNFYDFIINSQKLDVNNDDLNIGGKVFKIYFDKKEKKYILYFFHNSLILYYKVNGSVIFDIDKDYYLILGDIFLTINVKKLNSNEMQINIQTEIENEIPKKYIFGQNDMPIKIGRVNCNINISKPSISKLHSMIYFYSQMFYYQDYNSTNGSSLLIRENDILRIKGEMNFKLEDIPFKIREL